MPVHTTFMTAAPRLQIYRVGCARQGRAWPTVPVRPPTRGVKRWRSWDEPRWRVRRLRRRRWSVAALTGALATHDPGRTVPITVDRGGRTVTVQVTLGELPGSW